MKQGPAGIDEERAEAAEEAALIARIAAGESRGFGLLVDRYQRRLWWMCLRMLGDPEEADEVVQEAFVPPWGTARGDRSPPAVLPLGLHEPQEPLP